MYAVWIILRDKHFDSGGYSFPLDLIYKNNPVIQGEAGSYAHRWAEDNHRCNAFDVEIVRYDKSGSSAIVDKYCYRRGGTEENE